MPNLTPETRALNLTPPHLHYSARRCYWLCVASLVALIALCTVWELWLAPLRPQGSWLVLKALPLCWPLMRLLRARLQSFKAATLWVWVYACEGAVRAWGPRSELERGLALGEVFLCVVFFVAAVYFIRTVRAAVASQKVAP